MFKQLLAIQDLESFKMKTIDEFCSLLLLRYVGGENNSAKEWEKGRLSDLVELKKNSINPNRNSTEKFLHYSLPEYDSSERPKLTLGKEIHSNKFIISENSVLLSKLNPRIPRIWVANNSAIYRSICSTEFLPFTTKKGVPISFIYFLFRSKEFTWKMTSYATGTTNSHQRTFANDIMNFELTIPPLPKMLEFDEIAGLALAQRSNAIKARNKAYERLYTLKSKFIIS